VLQHQFWDMIVTDDRFEVGLSSTASRASGRAVSRHQGIRRPVGPIRPAFAVAVEGDNSADVRPADAEAGAPPARHDHSAPPAPLPWRPSGPGCRQADSEPPPAGEVAASIVSEKNSAPARRSMTRPRPFRYLPERGRVRDGRETRTRWRRPARN